MWNSYRLLRLLLHITVVFYQTSADLNSLNYLYTSVTAENIFTIVLVNENQILFYDNHKKLISKTEWMKKTEGSDKWNREKVHIEIARDTFKNLISTLRGLYTATEDYHTVQWMYGCELNDDGTTEGYERFGYDGEDFITLDLKTVTWTPANNTAETVIAKMDLDAVKIIRKDYLVNECIERLKQYMTPIHQMKVPPKGQVFQQQHSSLQGLVCHATGFFPRPVKMLWQKDGEEVKKDVELRETLPNQDESFQKRIILKVSYENLQKHNYTCVIQHSSLKEDLVLSPSLRGGEPGRGCTGIVYVAVIVSLLLEVK